MASNKSTIPLRIEKVDLEDITPSDQYHAAAVCATLDAIRSLCGDVEIGAISAEAFFTRVNRLVIHFESATLDASAMIHKIRGIVNEEKTKDTASGAQPGDHGADDAGGI